MTTSINSLALLNLKEATNLLYKFDIQPNDTKRSAIDRTRKRIKNGIVKGKITLKDNGAIQCGVLIDWARQHKAFKNKLNEFSSIYNHETSGGMRYGGAATILFEKPLPSSPEECQNLAMQLKYELEKLQTEYNLLQNEKIEFEDDATKWREYCIRNKERAKKARKV